MTYSALICLLMIVAWFVENMLMIVFVCKALELVLFHRHALLVAQLLFATNDVQLSRAVSMTRLC